MSSYNFGKKQVCEMLKNRFKIGTKVLDIGPCNGKWWNKLSRHFKMDAIEAWKPNIVKYNLLNKYDMVWNEDVMEHKDFNYDLIIFGDVLEHLTVEDAQILIERMYKSCKELLIAVPYNYEQDSLHGNPFEIHKQPDLTHEKFMERYPGFKLFLGNKKYGYYIKDEKID